MEKSAQNDQKAVKIEMKKDQNVILLLDHYNKDARMLRESFLLAGRDIPTIVIETDGFLPKGVISLFEYFLGDYSKDKRFKRAPLYFNEINIPDYWQIKASGREGSVFDFERERAKIIYADDLSSNKRLVKEVQWMDRAGVVRSCDHYNKSGALFARTICDGNGKRINKTYFSTEGKEIVTENFVTRNIILTDMSSGDAVTRVFSGRTEFVLFFMDKIGYKDRAVFYNSLSTPFMVSIRMNPSGRGDILFWQENPRASIPGNMQMILSGTAPRTKQIYVQNRESYEKFIQAGADIEKMEKLGFVYEFKKDNACGREALICTNSDQLEQIDLLAAELPEIHFNIAAKTEMSDKLMEKEKYPNVTLYPKAKEETIWALYEKCDWYFDINRGSEIFDAVYQAFLHNHIIFGFNETAHNLRYTCKEHLCSIENAHLMILAAKAMCSDHVVLEAEVERQRRFAMSEEGKVYCLV